VDAGSVDGGVVAWCRRRLGAEPAEVLFRAGYLSQVTGLRLADGRAVVLGALAATAEELVPTWHELAPGPDAAGRFAALGGLGPRPSRALAAAGRPPRRPERPSRPALARPDRRRRPGPPGRAPPPPGGRPRRLGVAEPPLGRRPHLDNPRTPGLLGRRPVGACLQRQEGAHGGRRPSTRPARHRGARALGAGRPPRLTAQSPRAGQGTKVSEPAKAGRASPLTARWPWPGRHMARALPNRSATAARTRRPPAGGDVSRRGPSVLLGPVHLRVGGGSGGGVA
jgi:hypothetical protein